MSVKLYNVNEGFQKVRALLPQVERVALSDVRCFGVTDKVMKLGVGDSVFDMGLAESQQFKDRTGIDLVMLRELSPELRQSCWRSLVTERDTEAIFKLQGDKVVSFSSLHATERDEEENDSGNDIVDGRAWVDRIAREMVDSAYGLANLNMTRGDIGFGVVTHETQTPPKRVNDPVHQGVFFTINGKVKARPYNMRLTCTNGAIGTEYGDEHVFTEGNFEEEMQKVLEESVVFTRRFVHLDEKPLDNAAITLGALADSRIVNPTQLDRLVRSSARLGQEATEYDLVNLITAQQHLDPGNRKWIQSGGMAINYLHHTRCTTCGHLV